ncbi:MAG: hypothetical protein HOE69_06370 [Euryarchaeota archaeon]|nr:hypothetical protein [Euryarchaeota archaeon]
MKARIVGELAAIDGVDWSALASKEGFILDVAGAPAVFLEATASLIPSIIETATEINSNAKLGQPTTTTINGSDGTLIITRINDDYSLIIKCEAKSNLGLIRKSANDAIANLIPLLE